MARFPTREEITGKLFDHIEQAETLTPFLTRTLQTIFAHMSTEDLVEMWEDSLGGERWDAEETEEEDPEEDEVPEDDVDEEEDEKENEEEDA